MVKIVFVELLFYLSHLSLSFTFLFYQISDSQLQNSLKCLVDIINSETITLASVAVQAMGHVGICIPLPPLLLGSTAGEIATFWLSHNLLTHVLKPRLSYFKPLFPFGPSCMKNYESFSLVMISKLSKKL